MAPTIAFTPPSLSSRLATLSVTRICAAANCPEALEDGRMTNHWVFYAAVSQGGSIRFDLSPTGHDTGEGCLMIRKHPDQVSFDAAKTCPLTVREGLTVKSILDCLQSAHYDQYNFTPDGQGCRFWVDSVVDLLQQRQITTVESETEMAHVAIQKVWEMGGTLVPTAKQTTVMPGTFRQGIVQYRE